MKSCCNLCFVNSMLAIKIIAYVCLLLIKLCGCCRIEEHAIYFPEEEGVSHDEEHKQMPAQSNSKSLQRHRYTELKEDIPIIIWWTERLFMETQNNKWHRTECPNSTCYSTKSRKFTNDPRGRGLYFYGTDLDPEDLPLPRLPHHEWALFHEESPINNFMLTHTAMINLFNHTATFRRESDFPLTTNALDSISYITQRQPVPVDAKNKYRRQGYAPVLYVQSHCNVASDRDRYVENLMKFIDVDSAGSCLNNKKLTEDMNNPVNDMFSPSFLNFISRYKFHLAFENALCPDYITEKLFRPLHVGSVPIHLGTSRAKDWMPDNHSVILVDNFESPEHLALYLKELDENDDKYANYLQYKKTGITNEFLSNHMKTRNWGGDSGSQLDMLHAFECHVCDKITARYEAEKKHADDKEVPLLPPKVSTGDHLNCPQPHLSVGDINHLSYSDRWLESGWIEDYWGGLDKANAIVKMIVANESDSKLFTHYWSNEHLSRP